MRRVFILSMLIVFAASLTAAQSTGTAKRATTARVTAPAAQPAEGQPPPPPPPPAPAQRAGRGTTQPAPPPPPPPPPAERRRSGQPINVKIELLITDQRGTAAPIKKTISAVVADGWDGMIRSDSQIPGMGSVPLHMDAAPEILADGKIRVRVSLEYDLPRPSGNTAEPGQTLPNPSKTVIQERVMLILENGKPIVMTQSADPVSDRQVTVEVKATILR